MSRARYRVTVLCPCCGGDVPLSTTDPEAWDDDAPPCLCDTDPLDLAALALSAYLRGSYTVTNQ